MLKQFIGICASVLSVYGIMLGNSLEISFLFLTSVEDSK